jgi:hypothetical protein
VKAWRDGDTWIEIRKVSDVHPSFQVGWIIELEWVGLCRVKEVVLSSVVPMQAGFSRRRFVAHNSLGRDWGEF